MSVDSKSIAARLLAAQLAIDAVLANPSLQAALTPFGYTAARMNNARALYEQAEALTAAQKMEYGEQYEATQTVNDLLNTAQTAYKRSLQLARIAFKRNTKAQAGLGLNGERKRTYSGWISQAELFYQGLLASPELLADMAQFGYDAAKVEAEFALVSAVRAAHVEQEREKGEAQDSTQARDAALDELDEWMSDFKTVAHIALTDMGQKLESLGFGPIP